MSTPAVTPAPVPRVLVLDAPPAPVDDAPTSLVFQALLPALGGLGMVLFMIAGGNRLFMVAGLVMLVVTVGGALGMAISTRSGARRRFTRLRETYLRSLDDVREEVRSVTVARRRHDDDLHPDLSALLARVATDRVRPRSRRSGSLDLVRVGSGPVPHPIGIAVPDGPADPVTRRAMSSLARSCRVIPGSPIVVDLAAGPLTLHGNTESARALTRSILLHVAATHDPQRLVLLIDTPSPQDWAWARWLPHLQDAAGLCRIGSPCSPPVIREANGIGDMACLVVVDRHAGGAPVPGAPGICVLTLTAEPVGDDDVGTHIVLGDDLTVLLPGTERLRGVPDAIDAPAAEATARALGARWSRGSALADDGERPPPAARTLGVDDLDHFDPEQAWAATRTPADLLSVTVGRDDQGRDLRLDLKESARGGTGPHGLLVGATGSGKSELLRSIVLGLAATHAPDELTFVLVDYKGGATFSGLETLPHVAGVVTNLADDLGLVDRVHDALVGELNRRQQILHDAGRLTDIYALRAARPGGQTLSHLILVVDEFAELLTAAPDLIDLFTAVGRIGRSIGVHQLLASQRLDDGRLRGLEPYLSYRFALRTFTPEESRAVIGSTDAADLPAVPGVGYLRTDRTTRFHGAYVSGPPPRHRATGARRGVQIAPWLPELAGDDVADAAVLEDAPSILDVAVARMAEAARPTRRIWLDPLPERLTTADLDGRFPEPGHLTARIGLVDLPSEQRMAPLDVDLARSPHLAVIGGPDSGRSSALRTLAYALARGSTPDRLVIHGVDFDGDSLRPLADLPHVGTVAGRREDEVVRRVVRDVLRTIDRRADRARTAAAARVVASGVGATPPDSTSGWSTPGSAPADPTSRASSASTSPMREEPSVILLLDGYNTVRHLDDLHEDVLAIATRGAEHDVHLVITTSRWHDLRPPVQASLHGRIELRLTEPMDTVIDRRLAGHLTGAPPGRALAAAGQVAQLLVPGDGVDERQAYRRLADEHGGRRAPGVPMLPHDLRLDELLAAVRPGDRARWWVGLGEDDLAPIGLGTDDPHLLVFGDRRSGRTSLLRSLIRQSIAEPDTVVALVDPRRTMLEDVPRERLASYAAHGPAATDLVRSLVAELSERATRLAETGGVSPASDILLVVDDAELLGGVGHPLSPLEPFLTSATDLKFSLVLSRHGGGAARALYDPLWQRLKETGTPGLLLSGDPEEGALWPGAAPRPLPPGRAILARRGEAPMLVHLARP